MDLLSRLFIFTPMKENKKFTIASTRNISELAALKIVNTNGGKIRTCYSETQRDYLIITLVIITNFIIK